MPCTHVRNDVPSDLPVQLPLSSSIHFSSFSLAGEPVIGALLRGSQAASSGLVIRVFGRMGRIGSPLGLVVS